MEYLCKCQPYHTELEVSLLSSRALASMHKTLFQYTAHEEKPGCPMITCMFLDQISLGRIRLGLWELRRGEFLLLPHLERQACQKDNRFSGCLQSIARNKVTFPLDSIPSRLEPKSQLALVSPCDRARDLCESLSTCPDKGN